MVTATGAGVLMVTDAAADFVLSACDRADTVTVFGLGAVAGAV
jgi:glutamate dehydrogenase/leucine dehydrogenase